MTFGQSISVCFSKYFDFSGRASRPEFWWFFLFLCIVGLGAALLVSQSRAVSSVVHLVLIIPTYAVGARRLHDVNRSGWWQLLGCTVIGLIPLFFWWAREGDDQENQYGNPV